MELRQLKYFIAAADSLNFSRAAESLYISQPTLSQQIAELEDELGVELFVRTKRSVLLTPAGADLLDKAKDLLHRSENLVRSVQNTVLGSGQHEVCIGYEPSIMDSRRVFLALSQVGMEMRERYPDLRLFYKMIPFDDQEKAVKNEEVDFLVTTRGDKPCNSLLETISIDEDRFELVYCSRQPAVDSLETVKSILAERPIFMQERELRGMLHVMKIFDELSITPRIMFMNSIETTKLLIASGDGCLIVPRNFRHEFNYEMIHFLTLDVPCNRLYTSVIRKKEHSNEIADLVIDELRKKLNVDKQSPHF